MLKDLFEGVILPPLIPRLAVKITVTIDKFLGRNRFSYIRKFSGRKPVRFQIKILEADTTLTKKRLAFFVARHFLLPII